MLITCTSLCNEYSIGSENRGYKHIYAIFQNFAALDVVSEVFFSRKRICQKEILVFSNLDILFNNLPSRHYTFNI